MSVCVWCAGGVALEMYIMCALYTVLIYSLYAMIYRADVSSSCIGWRRFQVDSILVFIAVAVQRSAGSIISNLFKLFTVMISQFFPQPFYTYIIRYSKVEYIIIFRCLQ